MSNCTNNSRLTGIYLLSFCHSPELNGIERFWQEVKSHIAWHNFETAVNLEQWLEQKLKAFDNNTIASITGYPYIIAAMDEVSTYALY